MLVTEFGMVTEVRFLHPRNDGISFKPSLKFISLMYLFNSLGTEPPSPFSSFSLADTTRLPQIRSFSLFTSPPYGRSPISSSSISSSSLSRKSIPESFIAIRSLLPIPLIALNAATTDGLSKSPFCNGTPPTLSKNQYCV